MKCVNIKQSAPADLRCKSSKHAQIHKSLYTIWSFVANQSSQFTFYCSIFDQYSVFHVDIIPLGFELAKDFWVANVAGGAAADYVSVLHLVIIVWSNNIITIGCHPQRHHHHHHHYHHGYNVVVDDYHPHVKPCSAHFVHRSTSKGSLLVVVVLLEGQLLSPTFREIKSR